MEKKIRVIDKRSKEKFLMDDAYYNGYAKICGWKATIVYFSLCRHSNKDQFCFPSIDYMAKQNNISRPSVISGLKTLKEWNIIDIEKVRGKGGTWKNNSYILLDKSVWKKHQVKEIDLDNQVKEISEPSKRGLLDQVKEIDSKETHIEGNTYKETHIYTSDFLEFYNSYPKKELKKKSYDIWKRHKLKNKLPEILSFIEKAKQTDRWKKGFIKQPPAFLNGECWEDDLNSYKDNNNSKKLYVG